MNLEKLKELDEAEILEGGLFSYEVKKIPGFDNYYACKTGKILSNRDWRGYNIYYLTEQLDTRGYPSVRLTISKKQTKASNGT